VEDTFLRCPSCLRRLKEPCQTCGKPLDPLWKICPYCESEISGAPAPAAPEPVRRRGRRSSAASSLAEPPPPARRREPLGGDEGATASSRPPGA
jgi:hypothetical protein